MEGLSIIITAYKTGKYIPKTIESIYSQDFIKTHSNYEVLVGIDGCQETLDGLRTMGKSYPNLRVFMMDSNRGTFVTSNTLISISKYDKILRFDSDDLMCEGMLTNICNAAKNADIVRYRYYDYQGPQKIRPMSVYAFGSVLYKRRVFDKCGGYVDWKCSGDYELFSRVTKHFKVESIDKPLYYHVIRQDSLMHNEDTAMKSQYRKKVNAQVRVYGPNENIFIKPAVNTYKEINLCKRGHAFLDKNDVLWHICEPYNGEPINPFYSNKERIIVTMTSWSKRITNVPKVVQTILDGNVLPDLIVVNLCVEEFPQKELSFPDEVKRFFDANKNIIEINWLKNNTKVWKKVIPTLFRYPNDATICIDDDFLYPKNFVETFKKKHTESRNQLVGVSVKIWKNHLQHCGPSSLDRLEWFGSFLANLNDDCMKFMGDDDFYTYCLEANGIVSEFVGTRFYTNMPSFSAIEGFTKSSKLSRAKITEVLKTLPSKSNVAPFREKETTNNITKSVTPSHKKPRVGNYPSGSQAPTKNNKIEEIRKNIAAQKTKTSSKVTKTPSSVSKSIRLRSYLDYGLY